MLSPITQKKSPKSGRFGAYHGEESTLNLDLNDNCSDVHLSSKKSIKSHLFPAGRSNGLPPLSPEERRIVAGYMKARADTLIQSTSLVEEKQGEKLRTEARRFAECGTRFIVLRCPNHDLRFHVPISCGSRICERCAAAQSKGLRQRIETVLRSRMAKKPRGFGVFMLTLTTTTKRHGPDGPARKDIRRFYRESSMFLRLFYGKYASKVSRTGKVVQVRVKKKLKFRGAGFIAATEFGGTSNMLHCHAIVFGPYISQKKLSAAWLKITGDSSIVDVRAVRSVKDGVREIVKYVIKPPTGDSLMAIADYAWRIKGTRRLRTGGVFYNHPGLKKPKSEKQPLECPYCRGYLEFEGEQIIGPGDDSQALYPLLREVKARGSPLPEPDGVTTLDARLNAEVKSRYDSLFEKTA